MVDMRIALFFFSSIFLVQQNGPFPFLLVRISFADNGIHENNSLLIQSWLQSESLKLITPTFTKTIFDDHRINNCTN